MDIPCRCESFEISSVIEEHFSSPKLQKNDFWARGGDGTAALMPELARAFAIWVSIAQWLERFAGHQKATGLIPVWGSEIVFLRLWLDNFYQEYSQSLFALQRCMIAVGKSKFQDWFCLSIIVCIWTMASLMMSLPTVETVSWFWPIFDSACFKLSSWLNAERVSVGWVGWFRTSCVLPDF